MRARLRLRKRGVNYFPVRRTWPPTPGGLLLERPQRHATTAERTKLERERGMRVAARNRARGTAA
jgi:hypothetical protein